MNAKKILFPLIGLVMLSGCELLQRQPVEEDGRTMMMMADMAPLTAAGESLEQTGALQLPHEPSPFEMKPGATPSAMLADNPSLRQSAETPQEQPRPLPVEPIPSVSR